MTDEDVFEPHSSLVNLDFVKGRIENSEKTKSDWIGLDYLLFLFLFLSGTKWKTLLQCRISNTQEPSLVFFFFNVNCQRCSSPKKKNGSSWERKKSKNKDFYQSGYLLTTNKRPRNCYLAPTHYYYFEEANSQRGREKKFLRCCCCLTVEVEVE